MKKIKATLAISLLLFSLLSLAQTKVLVFSKTAAFRHGSIGVGKIALLKLGAENGFSVDTTEDASVFTEGNLKKYNAVVFLSTTGDILNHYQQAAFERYIQAGGGYMGIHAASDCEYNWPWYGNLAGAYFKNHPKPQMAKLVINDKTHISTAHLPAIWERSDEWYNFKKAPGAEVHTVISIDESSYEGGTNAPSHPMAWYHDYDGGRAYYTELGHTNESFADPLYMKHLLGGIKYAIGNNVKLDYSKVKSQLVPESDRFTKNMLVGGVFDEPTEMAILPNLDIIIVQRKGEVLFYDHVKNTATQVAKLDLYHHATVKGVNAEEGLMGVTADPDYKNNHFIYLYYATLDTAANRLSRFIFKDGKLDLASEKKILDVGSQRNICCHTAGSLTFGPDGSLYLSTGDNTTPFNQPNSKFILDGHGPIDNRDGFEQYDGRRGSSNTNDLRGKVLRIKMNPDGSYSIPEGNLFKPGTPRTRPEIYTMGTRNPYRISVDKKTGFLYWGDVGPDANFDKPESKGPRGYDELNQARKAGYFGYPMYIGNNYPYRQFNYETGEVGDFFDVEHPKNTSKNNTGLVDLPPLSPAFIWYPYAASPEFPEVGTGGRNAMAGPIYHSELYPKETRYPDYYNNKLLFYEWIRGWMKMVTMDEKGNFQKMEPFLENTKFNSAIDIEVGPDGRFYILEYGSGWFSKNKDAGLSRLDYNGGNRAPHASIQVDKTSGSIPFTVKLDGTGSGDSDKDAITYNWKVGNTVLKPTASAQTTYTITKPGEYDIQLTVKDSKGASTKSEVMKVFVGNEAPSVSVTLDGGNTFYYPGNPVKYSVHVKDKEDGTTEKGSVDTKSIFVKVDYLSSPDKAQVVGHQVISSIMEGKNLAATLDCKICHKEAEKSIGPAFKMVANKYETDPKAKAYLTNKIIKGGSGVWGEVAMAAHPDLKQSDAELIVDYVLSLSKKEVASLPAQGEITPSETDMGSGNIMQVSATYTDKGGKGIKPLSATGSISLRSALMSPETNNAASNVDIKNWNDKRVAFLNLNSAEAGWLRFDNIDLAGIKSIELNYGIPASLGKGYVISWYQDSPNGAANKIGELKLENTANTMMSSQIVSLKNVKPGTHNLFFKIERMDKNDGKRLALLSFRLVSQ